MSNLTRLNNGVPLNESNLNPIVDRVTPPTSNATSGVTMMPWEATALAANVNLNTIRNPGFYRIVAASSSAPAFLAGMATSAAQPATLLVMSSTNDRITQILYHSNGNRVWQRTSINATTWSTWRETASTAPPNASTTTAGIVRLNNTTTSHSTTEAATANTVRLLDNSKQNTLVSGSNIRTINGVPLTGSGDITITGATVTIQPVANNLSIILGSLSPHTLTLSQLGTGGTSVTRGAVNGNINAEVIGGNSIRITRLSSSNSPETASVAYTLTNAINQTATGTIQISLPPILPVTQSGLTMQVPSHGIDWNQPISNPNQSLIDISHGSMMHSMLISHGINVFGQLSFSNNFPGEPIKSIGFNFYAAACRQRQFFQFANI